MPPETGPGTPSGQSNAPLSGTPATSPRILIVDDDASVRRVCTFALRNNGWSPEGEASSPDALRRILSGEKFDAILLDYAMPELDGIEFLRALESLPADRRPGVLMTSAHADGAVARQALRLGVWDFLPKPLTPEDLRKGVRRLLNRPAAATQGDARARALLSASRQEWAEARRELAHSTQPNDVLLKGLLAEMSGASEEASQHYARCNWSADWVHEGPEIWTELARRLDV